MFSKILHFMFGRPPQIFDAKGNVVHQLPEDRWKAWRERFQKPEYDWHTHRGTERTPRKPQN